MGPGLCLESGEFVPAKELMMSTTHVQNPAEIEHVAGDVSKNGAESNMAQQPAPSAAEALSDDLRDRLVAISEAIADQDDRAAQSMIREILKAPQPSPTPQADSQPAPVEVADAMADSQYLAGVSAGWNAANADDPNAALQKLRESRAGYLKPLSAARAPADSVTAPAGGVGDDVDAIALARYKVVPANGSMFHRFAVVAGDGKQQLYLGREIECANMARKFAGAFLDGAFYQANIAPTKPTQAADSVQDLQPVHDAVTIDLLNERVAYLEGKLKEADSVLEDAARLDWLDQQCEAYGFQDIHEGNRWEISGAYANVREAIDAELAARKQGGAT